MSVNVIPIQLSEQRINQTAADLQRVEMILHKAGLNLCAHHGATDDGDPWISFSDPVTDEVIIRIDLVDGEAVGHGPAFISAFKVREIEHAVQRLLRSLKLNPASGNITQFLLPVLVAVALMHAAEADADGAWLPLDAQNIMQAPVLVTMAAVIVVEKVVHATQHTVHEAIEVLLGSPDAEMPAGDEGGGQTLNLEAPTHPWLELAKLAPVQTKAPDTVIVAINADIDVPNMYEDRATEGIAFALMPTADDASNHLAPTADAHLKATLEAFLTAAASVDVVSDDGNVVVYGGELDEYHRFEMTDGSAIVLIGTESGATYETIA